MNTHNKGGAYKPLLSPSQVLNLLAYIQDCGLSWTQYPNLKALKDNPHEFFKEMKRIYPISYLNLLNHLVTSPQNRVVYILAEEKWYRHTAEWFLKNL